MLTVFQGKLPLTGIRVTEVENSEDSYKNAFEIKGNIILFSSDQCVRLCPSQRTVHISSLYFQVR